jgi:macrolide-specific efflux system membrane fusion protein
MPGIPVLTVMDLTKTFIQISLDQSSALRIKKEQKAELSFENLRGTKINGKVQKFIPLTDNSLFDLKQNLCQQEFFQV